MLALSSLLLPQGAADDESEDEDEAAAISDGPDSSVLSAPGLRLSTHNLEDMLTSLVLESVQYFPIQRSVARPPVA